MEKEQEKEQKEIPFLKIIYFDEEAATDLIYMKNKGKAIESIVDNQKSNSSADLTANAEIRTKTSIFSLFGLKFNIGTGASIGCSSEQLINQAITNTVLTDYLELIAEDDIIQEFKKSVVNPYKNSLSYYKIITPYMLMTEGKMDAGDFKVNVQLIDKAIKNGKGYFEMILNNSSSNESYVLRFNLKSFKNSYSLTDLVKMELTYHAVKVGRIRLTDLDIEREISFDNSNNFVDGTKIAREDVENDKNSFVDVFDVILSVVEND